MPPPSSLVPRVRSFSLGNWENVINDVRKRKKLERIMTLAPLVLAVTLNVLSGI